MGFRRLRTALQNWFPFPTCTNCANPKMPVSLVNKARFKMGFPRSLTALQNGFSSTSNCTSKLILLGIKRRSGLKYFLRHRTALQTDFDRQRTVLKKIIFLNIELRFKMGFPQYLTALQNRFPSTSNFASKLFYLGNELACFQT